MTEIQTSTKCDGLKLQDEEITRIRLLEVRGHILARNGRRTRRRRRRRRRRWQRKNGRARLKNYDRRSATNWRWRWQARQDFLLSSGRVGKGIVHMLHMQR